MVQILQCFSGVFFARQPGSPRLHHRQVGPVFHLPEVLPFQEGHRDPQVQGPTRGTQD